MQKSMTAGVASPKKPTPLAVIGLCCVVLALTLQAVGVATNQWVVTAGSVSYGLWQYCVSDSCSGHPDNVLTAASIIAAFVIFLVQTDLSDYGFSCYLTLGAFLLTLAGGVCLIINGAMGREHKPHCDN
ncbi:hypothetical protein ACOMHN_022448 [Nucella lapillus]